MTAGLGPETLGALAEEAPLGRNGRPEDVAQAILYRGAGFEIVWPQFLTLMAIGGAFFTIALLRFRKTIGTMA